MQPLHVTSRAASVIENLEGRTLFSSGTDVLMPAILRLNIPSTVVGGSVTHGSVSVHISNTGTAAPTGQVTVELMASTDGTSADAVVLGKRSMDLPLKAGKSTTVPVPVSSIPMACGSCSVFAETIDSAGTTADSTAFAKTVNIVAPFVALQSTATTVHPNIFGAKPHAFSGTITVRNTGNEIAAGTLTIAADGYNATHPMGSIADNQYQFVASIKPGRTEKFVVKDEYLGPGTVPLGTFNLALQITVDGITDNITAPGTYSVV